jgi:hypothetical protein
VSRRKWDIPDVWVLMTVTEADGEVWHRPIRFRARTGREFIARTANRIYAEGGSVLTQPVHAEETA